VGAGATGLDPGGQLAVSEACGDLRGTCGSRMDGLVSCASGGLGGRLQPPAMCGAAAAGGLAPAELLASSTPRPRLLPCGCGHAIERGSASRKADRRAERRTQA